MIRGRVVAKKDNFSNLVLCLTLLVGLLLVEIICSWINNRNSVSDFSISHLSLCLIVLLVVKLISYSSFMNAERMVVLSVFLLSVYELLYGLLQIVGVIESNHSTFIVTGSFINPNLYSGFLSMSFCVLISSLLSGKIGIKKEIFIKIALYAYAVLILSSQCRSSYLAIGACSVAILARYKMSFRGFIYRNKLYVILAIILVLVLLYYLKRPSVNGRLFIYKLGILATIKTGFKGVGLGNYQLIASEVQADYFANKLSLKDGEVVIPDEISQQCFLSSSPEYALCDPLQICIEAGVVTMITYLCVIILTAIVLFRCGTSLFYGLIAVQITSLFSYSMYVFQFQLYVAACVGLAISYNRKGNKQKMYLSFVTCVLISILILKETVRYRTYYDEWQSERVLFNAGDYDKYSELCTKKSDNLSSNIEFLYEYGCSLSLLEDYNKSDSVLKMGASLFGNPAFYLKLGYNSQKRMLYTQSESYYWKSFCISPNRVTPLVCLAEMYLEQGDTNKYSNMIQSIISLHDKNDSRVKKKIVMSLKEKI